MNSTIATHPPFSPPPPLPPHHSRHHHLNFFRFCGYGSRCRFNHPRDRGSCYGAVRSSGGEEYPDRPSEPVCQVLLVLYVGKKSEKRKRMEEDKKGRR
ncbi:putative transcription factor C3H family [Helianthus annuus]|nr:putative transcription factor C3H family [Helianthus annuus]